MKKTILAFQSPNGNFVRAWQYSQGHFDVVHTDDPLKVNEDDNGYIYCKENFETFFRKRGYKLVEIEFDIKVKEL